LDSMLADLGFQPAQIAFLRAGPLEQLAAGFIDAIHKRLSGPSGQDGHFRAISRHYGLEGEAPESLEAMAQPGNESASFEEALARCKSKSAQADFKRALRQVAIAGLAGMAQRPAREQVAGKLERLTNLRAAVDVTRLDYEAKRSEILSQIQGALDSLETEYGPLLESAEENISGLEAEIRTDVLLYGESVQGGAYRAVYTHGRVSWDNDGMAKYAASHPEIMRFRKQGEPSVSLRAVDEGR
jgi:hypothetical protein